MLSEFSIEHLRRAPCLALSAGTPRGEIARCLAPIPNKPTLDEPNAGVDRFLWMTSDI